jgi:hypothetical protein
MLALAQALGNRHMLGWDVIDGFPTEYTVVAIFITVLGGSVQDREETRNTRCLTRSKWGRACASQHLEASPTPFPWVDLPERGPHSPAGEGIAAAS